MGINQGSFLAILSSIGKRLFFSQTGALYYYFSLFPSLHDFLYGSSLPNPAGLFQFEHFPLTKWIFANGINRSWEIVGTAPSAFIGEIYANFGYPIMVLSILMFSMLIQFVQIKFITKPRTLLLTAYYVYFVSLSGQFALTSFFLVVHLYLIIFITVTTSRGTRPRATARGRFARGWFLTLSNIRYLIFDGSSNIRILIFDGWRNVSDLAELI